MPIIIIDNPSIFFLVIFSLRKIKLRIATKKYPDDSRIGPRESGIFVYANTEHKVAPKKIIYDEITGTFKYSLILFGYFFCALFFRTICETDEIKVPNTKINANRNFSFIRFHHQNYTNNDNQSANNHIPLNCLLKEQNSP